MTEEAKYHRFSIIIPSATVFFSSACIMIIELVAGRLIARHLGSSLYTWTSVIGIVLAGITIGNYVGGRIADRFHPRKTLALLFGLCSVACVVIVILNNIVGTWVWLWYLNWPARVFSHVALVFLLPSTLLGTISPIVAKMALDLGMAKGRTVGDIYAWGAAGSIAGTFLAGFYLIAAMGTIEIIWTVGAALLLMGILYWYKMWVLYIWAIIFVALMTMGMAPASFAQNNGAKMGLREKLDSTIIYEAETPYCYVAVKRISDNVDLRAFMQDKLKHSEVLIDNPTALQYFYTHIYAAITHGLTNEKKKISAMVIGGGGYVYPHYLEKTWPGSRVDVIEIDPGVTEAAMAAFGLPRDTTVNSINLDARNYVDSLLLKQERGEDTHKYDFIYEDAINDYSVPYQLVTHEFNEKIVKILNEDGVYLVNLIDIFDKGRFLGAMIETLEQTFSHVSVLSELAPTDIRNTFVVVASNVPLDLKKHLSQYRDDINIWYLTTDEIESLKQKADNVVMTDDYVPVENMLAPVVRRSALDFLSSKVKKQAKDFKDNGELDSSIQKYFELIEIEPSMSLLAYNEIGMMRVKQNRLSDAVEMFKKAIDYNSQTDFKINIASIQLNLAILLKKLGNTEESEIHLTNAIEGFRKEASKRPNSILNLSRLGNALAEKGDFIEASKTFAKIVNIEPRNPNNHFTLAESLEAAGLYSTAAKALRNAASFMKTLGNVEVAKEMEKQAKYLDYKQTQKGIK